ncbi:MAG: biotin--[acetyl-CoA-carboxylase] ligase [Christensenellaceae bacterium]|nr:biotin--[acetyl-CoA-carboxylase] ligase [Christensenellaceae bacterium]
MGLKSNVLNKLEEAKGSFISGEFLAGQLSVSRTAVWKAVKSLVREGHIIDSVPNQGYKLTPASNVISNEGILAEISKLGGCAALKHAIVLKSVGSTNTFAKQLIASGESNVTLIVSEEQTGGRGRLGREFTSPKGGLYFSLILPDGLKAQSPGLITTAVSLSVCRSLAKLTPYSPQIKWVNDVFLHGKKICGILTEGVTDLETGSLLSVIIGVGINYCEPQNGFPYELKNIAASIFPRGETPTCSANALCASVVTDLLSHVSNGNFQTDIAEYKRFSLVLGKTVTFTQNGTQLSGKAVDIDDRGGLIVETDGGLLTLNSGEISINLLK